MQLKSPSDLCEQQFLSLRDRLGIDGGAADHPYVFARMRRPQLVEASDSLKACP